ncbi:hypothetical protein FHX82_005242 [Amycolatopsis bartoniae]|uniref:CYTH domain-containing protein n=1 Tax=Amycolatopsis bartoniae TaxID=941986 RepID=A0A8H9M7E5_9PSEU|nr:hypothetical protein [Amycolatopsis bartoniae]TVT03229.1 CYTH domain-containing protein [Amycolatopsis bartoniae]GHF33129.1 hypothetical protein GCM10017566_02190 [Amycolatopsis bartoniae]
MTIPAPARLVERERKFDLDPGRPVPSLAGTGPVTAQRDPVEAALDATYFDTPDFRLARAKLTLRRRTGGHDEGWHLKLPAADGAREEVHVPLDASATEVPEQLLQLVREQLGEDVELSAAVRLKTRRSTYDLIDADGRVLAELADDQVSGETAGEVLHLDSWRELEVELAPGADPALLDTFSDALLAAGARPGHWPSKLKRMIAHLLPDERTTPGRRAAAPPPARSWWRTWARSSTRSARTTSGCGATPRMPCTSSASRCGVPAACSPRSGTCSTGTRPGRCRTS